MLESLLAVWHLLSEWWRWIALAWLALALVQAVFVILEKRSPVATLGWIVALCLMPIVGLMVYWGFGPQRVKRRRLKRVHTRAALASKAEYQALQQEFPDPPPRTVQHAQLIKQACGIPVSTAYRVEVLQDGVAKMRAMIEAIAQARHHVHLEYYIFEPDEIGERLRDALIERLQAGVTVRLLVDAVGSGALTGRKGRGFLKEFAALGGQLQVFHPTRFDRVRPLVNLRTHRKIVIVDGRVGFTGGINITRDENEDVCPEYYRDTHILLEGPVVRWLQYVFLEDWVYASGSTEKAKLTPDLIPDGPPGNIPAQIIASGPDSAGEAIHRSMIDAIAKSQQRVWLTTPYFVPTEPALYVLIAAAMRGIDVRILLPKRSDNLVVTYAARSYFDELLQAGVKIYEYTPRMLHAKTLLVDDAYVQIGTANYDHRSFRLNFEVAVAIYDDATNATLAKAFERDLRDAPQVSERGDRLGIWARIGQAVARLFSPLL